MRTLFDIRADLFEVLNAVDEETGEYLAGAEQIEALNLELKEKRKGIAIYIKTQKAFLESLKKAKEELDRKINRTKDRIEYLSEILMADLNGEKMNEPEVTVRYHNTRNIVDIAEGTELPEEFLRITTTVNPDKTKLKEALLEGEIVEGVKLIDKVSLIVK